MPHHTPVADAERLDSVDLVRGYALLGVLLMNIQYWFRNPPEPYWLGLHPFPGALNLAADQLLKFWFEAKSVTLFSMLFALGLCVQRERCLAKGLHWGGYASRRLGAMLLFGALHILLIWNGDILTWYATFSLTILAFLGREERTVRRWIQVLVGLLLAGVLVGSIIKMFGKPPTGEGAGVPGNPAEMRAWGEACIQAYQQHSWLAVARFRLRDFAHVFLHWPMLVFFGTFTFFNFLIGTWIWKEGSLRAPAENAACIGRFALLMLGIGSFLGLITISTGILGPFIRTHWAWARFGLPIYVLAQTPLAIQPMALGIGGALVWLWTKPGWVRVLRPLLPVGRMAFTNYIAQSLVCTFVFYGWGLGYYNHMGPAAGMGFGLILFGLQIPFSAWWLSRFRFGPLEWAWRCLTYGELQPFRH